MFDNERAEKIRQLFEEKLKIWQEKKGEEARKESLGELMYYGSGIPAPLYTLWDIIEQQIYFQSEKREVSPEEFIETLFRQENAAMFMHVLQI